MKKKNNFRVVAFIMVLALFAMPLFAQQGQGRGGQGQGQRQGQGQGQRGQMSEEDVKKRVAAVADTLQLNKKQEEQILAAELEFYTKIQKERQNFNPETGDRDAMREKMRTLREDVNKTYKEVCNEEQYEKYTKMLEQRRSQMQQRQGQGSSEGQRRGRGRGGN